MPDHSSDIPYHTSDMSDIPSSSTSVSPDSSIRPITDIVLRKSNRQHKLSSYLNEYVHPFSHNVYSDSIGSCTLSSLCSNSSSFSNSLITCCNVTSIHSQPPIFEPTSYEVASLYPEWKHAIASEFSALESNNTWSLVPLPPGKKAITCKWVFKLKHHVDGSIERYKARLFVKIFTQKEGIDYTEPSHLLSK